MALTLLIGKTALSLLDKPKYQEEGTTEYLYFENNSVKSRYVQIPQRVVSLAYREPVMSYQEAERIVNCLAMCESSNNEKALNHFDPDTPSYGLLQYKKPTWEAYCIGDIMNGEDQKQCAIRMVQQGGIRHWYNCAKSCGIIWITKDIVGFNKEIKEYYSKTPKSP